MEIHIYHIHRNCSRTIKLMIVATANEKRNQTTTLMAALKKEDI